MKLAWYTPYAAPSAIGRFSQLVVRELRAQGAEVTIVRTEPKSSDIRAIPTICPNEPVAWAADWDRHLAEQTRNYDLVVYNLGDHYQYHYYTYLHQANVPGLSILHDFSLHHALLQHCSHNASQHGEYLDHIHAECGLTALQTYERLARENNLHQWWDMAIAQHPVYRWALRHTLGVVTHANFYRSQVDERIGAPTTTIPLAYDSVWEPSENGDQASVMASPPRKLTILTVGSVNPNKRHQTVIQCLAHSKFLRERCQFRIVGHIESTQQKKLERLLESFSHRPDVVITGSVSRDRLQKELANAHILSCLRYPALEGASASVIEGILTGKPVIVCNTGCYQEIPDHLVFKIDPNHERSELSHTLEQILRHYDEATQKALTARQWAQERHSPAQYASAFLQFARQVLYNQPVLKVADRIADQLRAWNAPPNPQFLERIDSTMRGLFTGSPPEQRAA